MQQNTDGDSRSKSFAVKFFLPTGDSQSKSFAVKFFLPTLN